MYICGRKSYATRNDSEIPSNNDSKGYNPRAKRPMPNHRWSCPARRPRTFQFSFIWAIRSTRNTSHTFTRKSTRAMSEHEMNAANNIQTITKHQIIEVTMRRRCCQRGRYCHIFLITVLGESNPLKLIFLNFSFEFAFDVINFSSNRNSLSHSLHLSETSEWVETKYFSFVTRMPGQIIIIINPHYFFTPKISPHKLTLHLQPLQG